MSVTVIMPWRPGCPYRERARAWLLKRYAERHPDWTIDTAFMPAGPWVKAHAVNPAVVNARSEIVVVADADVWCDELEAATAAVGAGAAWAMPHYYVHRLTEKATGRFMAGRDNLETEEKPYPGMWGGGVVVAPRATLIDVPLDSRFVGWGCEDISWGIALDFLAGPNWRGRAPLWHLWHPPQDRPNRKRGCRENEALRSRYTVARKDPALIRALIDEVSHVPSQPDEPCLHDRASVGVG